MREYINNIKKGKELYDTGGYAEIYRSTCGGYVFRCADQAGLDAQHQQKMYEEGWPVPKVVYYEDDFSVIEFVSGDRLKESFISREEFDNIRKQLEVVKKKLLDRKLKFYHGDIGLRNMLFDKNENKLWILDPGVYRDGVKLPYTSSANEDILDIDFAILILESHIVA